MDQYHFGRNSVAFVSALDDAIRACGKHWPKARPGCIFCVPPSNPRDPEGGEFGTDALCPGDSLTAPNADNPRNPRDPDKPSCALCDEVAPEAGTQTGRVRCGEPNLSQVPRADSTRERMAVVAAERRIVKAGRLPHAVETLDPEDYAALAEAVNADYRAMVKDWGAAQDELSELRARDAVAYMRAAAETEVRAAEGRMLKAEAESKALHRRVHELEGALLEQGGTWIGEVSDSGRAELSHGISLDPMANIDARLRALTVQPEPAGVAGVAPVCPSRSQIGGEACEASPRHSGWHRATRGRRRVWWSS